MVRDAERHLDIIKLVEKFADETTRDCLVSQYPYSLMMLARARALQALGEGDYAAALERAHQGVADLDEFYGRYRIDFGATDPVEKAVLLELREEIFKAMPEDSPLRLERELEIALAAEDYKRAAELRDRMSPGGK